MSQIVIDSKVVFGKPHIKGTRISVEFLLNLLENGMEIKEIIKEYPHLKKADVLAAIAWSRQAVEKEEVMIFENDNDKNCFGRLAFA